ncbi:hypothetical protein FHG87_012545 [Trinorchestia longiramus]|nr:hypothetical protein FHG87_012545 [Trinorchestia longiramus]
MNGGNSNKSHHNAFQGQKQSKIIARTSCPPHAALGTPYLDNALCPSSAFKRAPVFFCLPLLGGRKEEVKEQEQRGKEKVEEGGEEEKKRREEDKWEKDEKIGLNAVKKSLAVGYPEVMNTESRKWRFQFLLLSIFGITSGVSSPVPPSDPNDLGNLVAEHRDLQDQESRYPTPEVSDSSFVWRAGQGTYRLGMQAPDQWRVENRNVDGSVWGQYFYRTPDGGQVNVQYNAGNPRNSKTTEDNQFLGLVEGQIGGAGQLLSPVHHDSVAKNEALRSLLQELQVQEQVLPYGALKAVSEGGAAAVQLREGDIVDEELQAVVTNVQHDHRV